MANHPLVTPQAPRAPLTAPEFQRLADVPPEAQWFANLDSVQTRRAYKNDLQAFMTFTGIVRPEEFRSVTRVCWLEFSKPVLTRLKVPSRRRPPLC